MASNLPEKHVSVRLFKDKQDYFLHRDESFDEEVLEIAEFSAEDIAELEKEGFFYMPNYITYLRKTAVGEDVLASLSKNKRKKVKKGLKEIEGFEVYVEEEVTRETFEEWYELYKRCVAEKDIGIVAAPPDWPEKDRDVSQKLGVFLRKGGKVVAGILTRSFEATRTLPRRLSISFSAISPEYKHLALNDCLNLFLIERAKEQGYEYVARGKDTNLYGKHLSAGIPVFKMSFGYEIVPLKTSPDILIKLNNLDEFDDRIFFVSHMDSGLAGNLIFKSEVQDVKEYDKDFLELRVFLWPGLRRVD